MSYDDRECDPTTLHEQNIVERGEAAVRAAVMRDLESGEKRLRPVVAEVDDLVSRLLKTRVQRHWKCGTVKHAVRP